jgi:hypothetical protein
MADLSLRPPKAPNLLIAPNEYQQRYIDQLNNALRLYFNQIDNGMGVLLSGTGGASLSLPFIAASDTADQLATAANTPTVVKWNTLEGGNGFTLNAPGSATALVSGIYKITYSLQFVNTDNAIHNAAVWLKVNNVDVPRSTTVFTLQARKSAGVYNFLCGYSEVVFTLEVDDVLELYWAVDQAYSVSPAADGIYMEFLAAQTVPPAAYARPAVPSAIGSITFVSRLPTTP